MKQLFIIFLYTIMLLSKTLAETNNPPLLKFLMMTPKQEIASPIKYDDNSLFRFRFSRSPEEQQEWRRLQGQPERVSLTKDFKPEAVPLFTITQSPSFLQVTGQTNTNLFSSLGNLSGLFNFSSVYTKISGDPNYHTGMALQLVLVNVAILQRYDIQLGPSYVYAGGTHCVQLGATMKFLETPGVQNAVANSPFKAISPVNLSSFYLYLGVGTAATDYQKWNISLGLGVKVGK